MTYHNSQPEHILSISSEYSIFNPLLTGNEAHLNLTCESSEMYQNSPNQNTLSFDNLELLEPIKTNDRKEEEISENEIYHVKQSKKSQNESSVKFTIKSKKRGRVKQKKINKIHDKHTIDNVLRKIQVNYITFLISFINEILKNLNYNERFLKLDYSIKKNINKDFFESLKTKNIEEIICSKISDKYKKEKKNNRNIFEKIKEKKNKEKKVIINILSENYLDFFWKIYYKSSKLINLKEYGLDKEITLSDKVIMYKDLLKKNEELDPNENYNNNINNCVNNNFIIKK
jgi:hypothetical protein